MIDSIKSMVNAFESYVDSFSGLSEMQQKNFHIKKQHSLRVAENALRLGQILKVNEADERIAFITGLFHDIGRFRQLVKFNTFNDDISVDHAEYSLKVIGEIKVLSSLDPDIQDLVLRSIQLHNKFELPGKLPERDFMHAKLLRDADKLDILRVLTDYYSDRNSDPNHTLTWNMPKGAKVSPGIAQDILSERQVSKIKVKSELDIKILQLSWVYDLNFKPSFEIVLQNRFLEKIYQTLPKNDMVIEIYRKIKVYAENKLLK